MTSFSDYEIGGETQILDLNLDENEGVIERLARLFSTVRILLLIFDIIGSHTVYSTLFDYLISRLEILITNSKE